MPKKPSLNQALSDATKKPSKAESAKKVEPGENLADDKTESKVPPSRRGKKAIVGHFSPEFCKQIKQLALDQDRSSQELLAEALRDLLKKYGEKPVD